MWNAHAHPSLLHKKKFPRKNGMPCDLKKKKKNLKKV